ncbi:helicase C-terminal domain-containing protein [Romboutsia hominis]|nr:helicase C-terminal domain-containing protein [Romboutsia hominis]
MDYMTKVFQGARRCIRTNRDKGVILLLDNRY